MGEVRIPHTGLDIPRNPLAALETVLKEIRRLGWTVVEEKRRKHCKTEPWPIRKIRVPEGIFSTRTSDIVRRLGHELGHVHQARRHKLTFAGRYAFLPAKRAQYEAECYEISAFLAFYIGKMPEGSFNAYAQRVVDGLPKKYLLAKREHHDLILTAMRRGYASGILAAGKP